MGLFKVKHRPDGVITLPNGQRVAIETERNLKTKARYQEIMKSHLLARTNEDWFLVYYIVPDEQKKLALMKLFDSITFLTFNGRPMTLEGDCSPPFRARLPTSLAATVYMTDLRWPPWADCTTSPAAHNSSIPFCRILIAALISRSCSTSHSGHCQIRLFNGISGIL